MYAIRSYYEGLVEDALYVGFARRFAPSKRAHLLFEDIERLQALLGEDDLPWVATFHATCVRILRREISALGFSADFTIYDDQDQLRLLKEVLRELRVSEKIVITSYSIHYTKLYDQ